MYQLENLIGMANSCHTCIDGKYVPARPSFGSMYITRLKDAWEVLVGRADAFTWPSGQ